MRIAFRNMQEPWRERIGGHLLGRPHFGFGDSPLRGFGGFRNALKENPVRHRISRMKTRGF